jgi:hypothetical protein
MRAGWVATTGFCAVLALLTGCGGKSNGSATAIASTEVHESASAEPSPTAGPTTAPTPAAPVPAPSTNNKSGFAWANQPGTASYTLSHAYRFTTSGGQIHVNRFGTGAYEVVFDGIGSPGGIAHATAYGANSNFCNVLNWGAAGGNEIVAVQCFSAAGAPVDSTFLVNYASKQSGLTRFSYLWADQPAAADYAPASTYRYDSTGGTPKVKRTATGRYRVTLPASADLGGEPYTFQVTAYGSTPMHCKITATYVAAATHQVDCLNTSGIFADTTFEVTFASSGSFIGRDERRYGEYTDVSPAVVVNPGGNYTVPASEMGQDKGQVMAYAEGGDGTYCHTGGWAAAGTTLNMVVRCFNIDGSPAESQFRVMVTW